LSSRRWPSWWRAHRSRRRSAVSRFEPLDRTITDPVVVGALYRAILALPAKPPSDNFCPLSFGLRYRLTFESGPKATRATTESFWAELAGGLGLYTRGNDLFPLPRDLAR